jgi:hypothetical protein
MASSNVLNNLNPFSSSQVGNVQGDASFISTNSIISKFAFLILVLILFMLALRLGSSLLSWLMTPSGTPNLIPCLWNAKTPFRIPQNPAVKGSQPIMRSVNNLEGLEFTWSVWIFVDDFTYNEHEYKHVFHKGNDNFNVSSPPFGVSYPNNAPGLYITPDVNDLLIIMNTFDKINDNVIVKDLPLHKWVNIIIRVSNQHQLDVYINGTLAKRHILAGIPKQNYGDVFACYNGGFSGYLSALKYYNKAIGTNEIQSLVEKGPSLKLCSGDNSALTSKDSSYLATRWYFSGATDGYN